MKTILAILATLATCHATTYLVTWDAPVDAVDHWIVFGPNDFPLALTESPSVSICAEQLTPITVVAVDSQGNMSEPSEPCYLPPAKAKQPIRVTLQRGGDLQGWENAATFYYEPTSAEFYRLKIETP